MTTPEKWYNSCSIQLDVSTEMRHFLVFKYICIDICVCIYIYTHILKNWERKCGKLLLFLNAVWKIIIINWYDSNAGFFLCWAVNWYSNSFQDIQFCSVRCIQQAKMCGASKKWELWEWLWQRSQDSTQTHSFR